MAITLEAIREMFKEVISDLDKKYEKRVEVIEQQNIELNDKITDCEERVREEVNTLGSHVVRLEQAYIDTLNRINTVYNPEKTNSLVEINLPKFFGNSRDTHPLAYLKRLEKYFERKNIKPEDKLLLVEDSLKGNAGNWFSMINYLCNDYDNFKQLFIDEYWSRGIQLSLWSQFSSSERVKNIPSYREYFAQWMQKVKYFDSPKLTEAEAIVIIARHFPGYIQAMLVSMPSKTFLEATTLLGGEDANRKSVYQVSQNRQAEDQGKVEEERTNERRNPFYRNNNIQK
ncbi:uncharacterized protein LOC126908200, partial [Daktulosphaira vitifoliae]|uniref:uncharacterized protein LOC126908200 n=1 Tax=Daktulosphaira vitifoliae TaxID=58002 RepID=UPI0021AA3F36